MSVAENYKTKQRVDVLGRQNIIDKIIEILGVISSKHSCCTFALNGTWGTGKTFVLDMLMKQLWELHSDKYIVLHYNCWQYDYYDEPLVAIVAAVLDSLDEENQLLPVDLEEEVKAGIDLAKDVIKKVAVELLKNKTGIDLNEALNAAEAYQEKVDELKQAKTDERSFDEFYSFKKAIKRVQEEIEKLAKDRTVVVVVDELDRCLPTYAIKVLERLHHLFTGVENSAVFLAVDKAQLDKTVSGIFGEGSTDKYLRKFVNFELELDRGEIIGGFWDKYPDYCTLFDPSIIDTNFRFEHFINIIFSDMDIRDQELLMDKVKTAHLILFPDEKKDYSFMCGELMYAAIVTSRSVDLYAISRQQNNSDNYGTPTLEYSYDGPTSRKLENHFREVWSLKSPIEYSERFQENMDPKKFNFTEIDDSIILGGSAVIQELLRHYWNNLLRTIDSDKPQFITDFAFLPAPKGVSLTREKMLSFIILFSRKCKNGTLIKNAYNNYNNLEYIEKLFSQSANEWLASFANKNLNDLIAFKKMFDLLH